MRVLETEGTGPFYVGDRPSQHAAIVVDGDLSAYVNTEVVLRKPDGTVTSLFGIATISDDTVHVDLSGNYFTGPGVYKLQVILSAPGIQETLRPVGVAIETAAEGWMTTGEAQEYWPTVEHIDGAEMYELLQIAKRDCIAYLDRLYAVGAEVKEDWRRAQVIHARNIYNATKVDAASGVIGEDGTSYKLTTFPMDWHVKNLLRPQKGGYRIG